MTGPGILRNRQGERLDFTLHPAGAADRAPGHAVILGHGVTSNKDRPWLVVLAGALAAAGLTAVRISFAGNGDSGGRYEAATLSKEVEDLGSALDGLGAWGVGSIGYVGHSMGAAVGVLRAASDPRIRALVSLAGMVHVHAFMQRHFGRLVAGRDMMLDKPGCPWNEALARDAAAIGSVTPQAGRIAIPWLLVHGDADELVPLADSADARAAAGGRPELVTLPGVDHRFTDAVPAMIDAVVPWLHRHLVAASPVAPHD